MNRRCVRTHDESRMESLFARAPVVHCVSNPRGVPMRPSRIIQPLLLAGIALFALSASAQKTQLLVYTALETDQIKAYQEGFNKVYPDIEIKWVRDSTGVITAKLLAEKSNPQADVVMGVAASSLALLDKQGMLEPYAPL